MKIIEKNRALELRKTGLTYKEILAVLPVSKSSLSYWLRGIELTDDQKHRVYDKDIDTRKKFIEHNRIKHEKSVYEKKNILDIAGKEIGAISERELKLIGAALYWAEGYKSNRATYVEFTNSDPIMIRLVMKWFKEICNVPKGKFRIKIQIHSAENIKKAIEFWSSVTKVPREQFLKPYIKISPTSQNKVGNVLANGICHIRISDTKLLTKIRGWINGFGGPIV